MLLMTERTTCALCKKEGELLGKGKRSALCQSCGDDLFGPPDQITAPSPLPLVGQACPRCHGSGQNPEHPGVMCNYCAGSGQLPGT